MKRKCVQDLRFGFCDTEDGFYEIDAPDCDYFKALDTSLILCNREHAQRDCHAAFLHQTVPDCFAQINLPEFSQLFRFVGISIKQDFDFADWNKLLDFLHAAPGFKKRLHKWAETLNLGQLNIVSAFREFGITCTEAHWSRVPATDENVDFFVGNNANVLITSVARHPIYVPSPLLDVLKLDQLWLSTIKLVAPSRCSGDVYMLSFRTIAQLEVIYAILVNCGYMIGVRNGDQVYAVAPHKTLYDNIEIQQRFDDTKSQVLGYCVPDQVCLVSPSTLLYSANAKHEWTYGFKDDQAVEIGDVALAQRYKFPLTPEFQVRAQMLYSTSKLDQWLCEYPRQLCECGAPARVENIGFLRQQRVKVKTLEELQLWFGEK